MVQLMTGMINLLWKTLSFSLVVSIFFALLRSGKDTVKTIRDTVIMVIRVGCKRLQCWLFDKYKEP